MPDPKLLIDWQARWAEVNKATAAEANARRPAERLRDLARLRAFALTVGMNTPPDDEAAVWARFERLRSIHRARATR